MDPASPTKFPMSPGMPVFPVSPERVAGTKPPYGSPGNQSPTLPDLRTSPLRSHRRNDSDVSVHGLAAMFENLEVKDFKEAQSKYMQAMQRQKTKHATEIRQLEKDHALNMGRREMRIEELKAELKKLQESTKDVIAKDIWDRKHKEQREAIAKWEKAMQYSEEKRKQAESKAYELDKQNETLRQKYQQHKKKNIELHKDNLRTTGAIPTLQAKIQSMERHTRIVESDLKFKTNEAEKYKHEVYGLQVDLESLEARLGEENQTLKDKLRLVEAERDALKTSLKEEEVLRIAAEGQIPLPAASTEEYDDFGSPVRSPRKQRSLDRDEEDKENVAPKKSIVELRLLQQELATEKRLRERAQDQIEFMKMECQFQCCSCRIAENKGKHYVHDNSYATDIERIKSSVPALTPPASIHGEEDHMEDIVIKQEPTEDELSAIPPPEEQEEEADPLPTNPPADEAAEPAVAFSPTTGTFRSVSSPVKGAAPEPVATPAKPSRLGLSAITEMTTESSPWTPDAHSTVIPIEATSPPQFRAPSQASGRKENKPAEIIIHEDAVMDSEDDEPQTPVHGPSGPATPGQYLTRTITTTTTIPLHFSPMTPAVKPSYGPITPSTVAHAPSDARTPVLGELSMNNMPFDREAALEAIRQRRGRARSMAAGHGTPRKQMMEGVKERRDISAPVSRLRR